MTINAVQVPTNTVLEFQHRRVTQWEYYPTSNAAWAQFNKGEAGDQQCRVYLRRTTNAASPAIVQVAYGGGIRSLSLRPDGTAIDMPPEWRMAPEWNTRPERHYYSWGERDSGNGRPGVEVDVEDGQVYRVKVWCHGGGDPLWFGLPGSERPTRQTAGEAMAANTTATTPESDWALLNRMLNEEAETREWCSEFEAFIAKFNHASQTVKLKGREEAYEGVLNVRFEFSTDRNGNARAGMEAVRDAVWGLLQQFETLNDITVSSSETRR